MKKMHVDYREGFPYLKLPEKFNIINAESFSHTMNSLYQEGYREIAIDFSEVIIIDSLGLGKIILFHKKLKQDGGELRLINVKSTRIQKMFKVIHLHRELFIEGLSTEDR